jgi:hypothetical protein
MVPKRDPEKWAPLVRTRSCSSEKLLAAAGAMLIWLCGSLAASATELPIRKPGLWEIKIKLTGGAAPTAMMRHCTDAATDPQMSTMFNPLAPLPCAAKDVQKHDNRFTIDSVCRTDDKTVTQHSDVSGDFATSYTVVTETKTQEGPDSEPSVTNMTLEGHYLGACKAEQKPGDVVMAGGLKVNVTKMDEYRALVKR